MDGQLHHTALLRGFLQAFECVHFELGDPLPRNDFKEIR